jgi:N-acetylmuramic acid 6-phosphate etherase
MSDRPATEQRNPRSMCLGSLEPAGVVALMDDEEQRTLAAVRAAAPAIARAAEQVAACFAGGGRTVLLGSGTSGRIALGEVAELPPTFGVGAERFLALGAGGRSLGPFAITTSEDDIDAAPAKLAELGIGPGDAVIGIAASGTTPFVLAGIDAANRAGAWSCAIANNTRTPLLEHADLAILLDTGPEVLCGSTRLQAGTAQKLALNRITTAAMVRCGRIVENHMVDVVVTIDKLRERAVRIVSDLTGITPERARTLLERADWSVRDALAAQSAT